MTPTTLFLDRDGVLNQRIVDGYVTRPDDFVIIPGVLEALKMFAEKIGVAKREQLIDLQLLE